MTVYIVQIRQCNCGFNSDFGDHSWVYYNKRDAKHCEETITKQWNLLHDKDWQDMLPIEIIECKLLKIPTFPVFEGIEITPKD